MAREIERGAMGSKKRKSRKAEENQREKDLAKAMGAQVHPASGATDCKKGDFSTDKFLFDSKNTKGETLMISRKELVKLDREATQVGKLPALVPNFHTIAEGVEKVWVMVPMSVFVDMLDAGLGDNLK